MKQIYIYLFLLILMLILVMILILISVAFLTLMERKILGFIQIRKGPNKVGYIGILQPFSDAIKLLSKDINMLIKFNYFYFYISPMLMFLLIFMMWLIYPFYTNLMIMDLGIMYLMCCLSFSVYGLLITGWSSNSSYSMLGSIRSLSQSISYEVSLSLIMLIMIMLVDNFNLISFFFYQNYLYMFIYMWMLSLFFMFSMMAELNRTPFDFSEGESELVSGFNVEYMSSGFILIFLSEYSAILFLSFLFSMFFLGGNYYSMLFYLKMIMMVMLIIWIRGTLPRFRYDLLMYLCWMVILPFTLNYLYYLMFFKMLIYKLKMMEY